MQREGVGRRPVRIARLEESSDVDHHHRRPIKLDPAERITAEKGDAPRGPFRHVDPAYHGDFVRVASESRKATRGATPFNHPILAVAQLAVRRHRLLVLYPFLCALGRSNRRCCRNDNIISWRERLVDDFLEEVRSPLWTMCPANAKVRRRGLDSGWTGWTRRTGWTRGPRWPDEPEGKSDCCVPLSPRHLGRPKRAEGEIKRHRRPPLAPPGSASTAFCA
jgi:hypothetical protein